MLDKINPFIRYAKTHRCFAQIKERSVCYDCRLFYLASGKGRIEVSGNEKEIREGTLIYLPPRTVYRFTLQSPESIVISVINFDLVDSFSNIKDSLGTARESEFDLTRSPAYPIAEELARPIILDGAQFANESMTEITEAHLLKSEYYKEKCSARLKLLLFNMLTSRSDGIGRLDPALAVEQYVKENYQNHGLDNGEIAKAFNYHPYHVNRLIKARTGKTLHEYLVDFRLHIAKSHLSTSALSVTEIADVCGFSSYNYFIKCFRERVGVSPLKYRREKGSGGL